MHPIFLKLGPIIIYSYGVTLVVGFLTATWLAGRSARRLPPHLRAITEEQVVDFTCVSLTGGILGARLLYVILQWEFFAKSPWEIPALWHGGLVWYGGFLGGLLSGWCYVRANRLTFLRVMDLFVPYLALGHAIGRIGCFLNGCCYGRPTTAWCGVLFPGAVVKVLPTQLFEAAGLFFLYFILRQLQQPARLQQPGRLFGWYLVGYGTLRFLLEFFRGDQTIWWMGLTLQQFISLGMLVSGVVLLGRRSEPASSSGGVKTRAA